MLSNRRHPRPFAKRGRPDHICCGGKHAPDRDPGHGFGWRRLCPGDPAERRHADSGPIGSRGARARVPNDDRAGDGGRPARAGDDRSLPAARRQLADHPDDTGIAAAGVSDAGAAGRTLSLRLSRLRGLLRLLALLGLGGGAVVLGDRADRGHRRAFSPFSWPSRLRSRDGAGFRPPWAAPAGVGMRR